METKEQIIEAGNNLLIERGFNAFSYKHISEKINIKSSSIHYHFPTKTDLGIAIIKKHLDALENTIEKNKNKSPIEKIDKLFLYYKRLAYNDKVCIVGAMSSDIKTLEEPLRLELLSFSNAVVRWTSTILQEGIEQNIFKPLANIDLNAKLLISNLMSLVQISRIENDKKTFDSAVQLLSNNLLKNNS